MPEQSLSIPEQSLPTILRVRFWCLVRPGYSFLAEFARTPDLPPFHIRAPYEKSEGR
jgi:hypothetical protein